MILFRDDPFKPALDSPLYQQLYSHLRRAILTGKLKGDTKLPSTRALADELGVSRNIVLNAYEQLLAEGYLESSKGSGTFAGGGVAGDLIGLPNAQLAVLPSTTHITVIERTSWFLPMVEEFLSALE